MLAVTPAGVRRDSAIVVLVSPQRPLSVLFMAFVDTFRALAAGLCRGGRDAAAAREGDGVLLPGE